MTRKLAFAALFSASLLAAGCDSDEDNKPVTTNGQTSNNTNRGTGMSDNAGNNAVTSDRNIDRPGDSPLINPNDRPLAGAGDVLKSPDALKADKLDAAMFVQEAASGGLFEVESSKVALNKSLNDQGKEFANMMVADHQKANMQLMQLAEHKKIKLDPQMLPKHQQMLDELSKIEGPAFQKRYHELQLRAHNEAIALFDRASKSLDDAELKQFATETLPTLRKHHDHLSKHNHNTVENK